jgi:hypothetical protein
MRAALIVTAVAAVLLGPGNASVQARDYAFCAYGGKTSEGMRCDYSTLAQCQASTTGGGGSCVANPSVAQGSPAPRLSGQARR